MNLALPERTEAQLRDLAQQQGVTTETYITRLLETHAWQQNLNAATETRLLQQVNLGFTRVQWRQCSGNATQHSSKVAVKNS